MGWSFRVLLCIILIGLPLTRLLGKGRAEVDTSSSQLTSSDLTKQSLLDLGIPFTKGNSVVLLPNGEAKFKDLFIAIRQAKRYIHLEYFNYRNDSIGWALFNLLGEKSRQGVEVKVLCDDFGNRSNDHPLRRRHLDSIRAMGINIQIFDPIRFPWFNHAVHRDHMKIVVIDGDIVYSGGMNVADYYIHGKPKIGSWHDMHMRLEGPVVAQYEDIFAQMWKKQTGETLDAKKYYGTGEPVEQNYHNLKRDETKDERDKTVAVVFRRPHKFSHLMRKAYAAAIDAARYHIQIVNPYPTNVHCITQALKRALRRGVRIDFMVSAKSDVSITPDVVGIQMRNLMRRGCNVYYYEEGFHHSKYMVVDGEFCTVGSANLDARSMIYDYEVNAFIFTPTVAHQLQTLFESDLKHCTLLTPKGWRKRFNVWHRFVGRLFGVVKAFI